LEEDPYYGGQETREKPTPRSFRLVCSEERLLPMVESKYIAAPPKTKSY